MSSGPEQVIEHFPFHPVSIIGLVPSQPPTGVTYSFWVPGFVIRTTRAHLSDTDFATLGVAVTAADGTEVAQYGPTTVSLGDLGDGTYPLNMHVAGVSVPEGGSMAVAFTILNHRSSETEQHIEAVLNEFAASILQALASGGMKGGAAGAAGSAAGAGILGLSGREAVLVEILGPAVPQGTENLLAGCGGLVVTESLTITQAELAAKAGQVPWTWLTEYKGTNSPDGCGANSDYTVSYTVMASRPA